MWLCHTLERPRTGTATFAFAIYPARPVLRAGRFVRLEPHFGLLVYPEWTTSETKSKLTISVSTFSTPRKTREFRQTQRWDARLMQHPPL